MVAIGASAREGEVSGSGPCLLWVKSDIPNSAVSNNNSGLRPGDEWETRYGRNAEENLVRFSLSRTDVHRSER